MYTEKSVKLKSDFYARYGQARGELCFAKTGIPCTVLDGDTHKLMFSLKCGVRAYGRGYGDVLKVLDCDSDINDVHFVENGKGAQILYKTDIPDIKGVRETVLYTVNKLLVQMGSAGRISNNDSTVAQCDRYAPEGWCAVKSYDEIKSVPLPVQDYNILLIRTRKNKLLCRDDALRQFHVGERERIKLAMAGLKECREEVLFDMLNESQKSIERLLSPSGETVYTVHATYGIDGIDATRICDPGIICFCRKNKTDNAVLRIRLDCEKKLGYSPGIMIVK